MSKIFSNIVAGANGFIFFVTQLNQIFTEIFFLKSDKNLQWFHSLYPSRILIVEM